MRQEEQSADCQREEGATDCQRKLGPEQAGLIVGCEKTPVGARPAHIPQCKAEIDEAGDRDAEVHERGTNPDDKLRKISRIHR